MAVEQSGASNYAPETLKGNHAIYNYNSGNYNYGTDGIKKEETKGSTEP